MRERSTTTTPFWTLYPRHGKSAETVLSTQQGCWKLQSAWVVRGRAKHSSRQQSAAEAEVAEPDWRPTPQPAARLGRDTSPSKLWPPQRGTTRVLNLQAHLTALCTCVRKTQCKRMSTSCLVRSCQLRSQHGGVVAPLLSTALACCCSEQSSWRPLIASSLFKPSCPFQCLSLSSAALGLFKAVGPLCLRPASACNAAERA